MGYLFKNAGLIGLGLIGGSLARAMKKHGLATKITGYTNSVESSKVAKRLGIIDDIAPSLKELAEKSDIIIISTPISSYGQIAREISSYTTENCIITDVGSLKLPFIEIFSEYLPKSSIPFLVPAHPIAGTEKTGVESGFAELFEGKKTILTPTALTNKKAMQSVKELWQACGSSTKIVDAARHDMIYAEVSHLPQFLAFCYAELLRREIEVKKNNECFANEERFWTFTRICASNPLIWLDIFRMNKTNLLGALDNFTKHLLDVGVEHHSFPALISTTLIKCSPHAAEFGGSGFRDFTSYEYTTVRNSDMIKFTSELIGITQELADSIRSNSPMQALEFMNTASSWYKDFRNKNHPQAS